MPTRSLPPSERCLLAQTLAAVFLPTLTLGGSPTSHWARPAIIATVSLAVIPICLSIREDRAARQTPDALRQNRVSGERRSSETSPPARSLLRSLTPFLPLFVFLTYVAIGLLNLSHVRQPDGGWIPRAAYIPWLPTTVDRSITLVGIIPWAAALAQGGTLAFCLRSRRAVHLLFLWIIALVLLLAMVGSAVWFSGSHRVLGLFPVDSPAPFATFLYRNHWAAFALLAVAAAAGEAFTVWDRARDNRRAAAHRQFALCALLLILISICLPGSRSGTAFALLLLLLVAFAILRRLHRSSVPIWKRPLLLALTAFIAALVLVPSALLVGPSLTDEWTRLRLEWRDSVDHGHWNARVPVARDTLRLVLDRPWFGWGAGTYFAVFPLYQGDYDRAPDGTIINPWDEAHCDWLQLPAEFGFIGLAFFLATAACALRRVLRALTPRTPWLLLGCGLVALDALADFPFQNPPILLLWTVLLVTAGCANASRRLPPTLTS